MTRAAPPAVLLGLLTLAALAVAGVPAGAGERPSAPPATPTAPLEPSAPGLAVEGSDYAYLRVADPVGRLTTYENAGYRLVVRGAEDGGREVVVEVSLAPLGSDDPFPVVARDAGPVATPAEGPDGAHSPPAGSPAGTAGTPPAGTTGPGEEGPGEELARLAREVTAEAGSRYEAVSAVLGWIVHHLVSEETATQAALARRPLGGEAPPATAPGSGKAVSPPAGKVPAGTTAAGTVGPGTPVTGIGVVEGGGGDAKGPVGQGSRAGRGVAAPDLLTVVERGSGSAREVARLAVALLSAVGIEARTVEGQVVGVPEIGNPWGSHTWIEVRYPDVGWVFSDPWAHHHYVPATYVRFAPAATAGAATTGPGLGGGASAEGSKAPVRNGDAGAPQPDATDEGAAAVPAGSGLRLVERRDRRETVDLYPAGAPGVTARKNGPGQQAGALRVVVSGAGRGSAVLEGEGERRAKILVSGESVFVGLRGGAYRLEVYLEGRPPIVREVRVGSRERRAVFLRDPQQATRWDPGATSPGAVPGSPGDRRRGRPHRRE